MPRRMQPRSPGTQYFRRRSNNNLQYLEASTYPSA